ncbi:MAG: HAD-IIIA family hydrolase [Candidatus Omnitrophica bacterium]|nr:HAD-IIIA family hydrolase [Candidatus Omnitrophota bacterium]
MKKSLKDKIKKVKLLVLDVDGILTDGRIIVDDKGQETKNFNVQDGFGIVLFQRLGFKTAIISARASEAVKARAKDLKIDHVHLDAHNKLAVYKQLIKQLKIDDDHVCFMGDDLPDLAVAQTAGVTITVPNACKEIKKEAAWITERQGGHGAVREAIEMILESKNLWNGVIKEYSCA